MKKTLLILLAVITTINISCRKDDKDDDDNNNNNNKKTCVLEKTFGYDSDGQYKFDDGGRLMEEVYKNKNGTEMRKWVYTRSSSGQLITAKFYDYSNLSQEWTYSYSGNLINGASYIKHPVVETEPPYEVKIKRDASSNIIETTIGYTFSGAFNVIEWYKYEYDGKSNITKITDHVGSTTTFGNYNNQPNPKVAWHTFHPDELQSANNPGTALKVNSSGTIIYDSTFDYEYDTEDKLVKKTETLNTLNFDIETEYQYNCK